MGKNLDVWKEVAAGRAIFDDTGKFVRMIGANSGEKPVEEKIILKTAEELQNDFPEVSDDGTPVEWSQNGQTR